MPDRLEDMSIVAWVGEDELGNGRIGIKQGHVPAGYIPLAAMGYDQQKLERLLLQMEAQAATWGKRIRLVRFKFDCVLEETEYGQ